MQRVLRETCSTMLFNPNKSLKTNLCYNLCFLFSDQTKFSLSKHLFLTLTFIMGCAFSNITQIPTALSLYTQDFKRSQQYTALVPISDSAHFSGHVANTFNTLICVVLLTFNLTTHHYDTGILFSSPLNVFRYIWDDYCQSLP